MRMVERLATDCADGPAPDIGAPYASGERMYNAYWILKDGRVQARFLKYHLPNGTIFVEKRIYDRGAIHGPVRIGPIRIGCPIGQDARDEDVAEAMAESGAQILLVPNGSPY